MPSASISRPVAILFFVIGCHLPLGCSATRSHGLLPEADKGPPPGVQVGLKAYGLPENFFLPGVDTKCAGQIVGYRFVVWLGNGHVAVGFNTSPNCRAAPNQKVKGSARVLVFDLRGKVQSTRDVAYEADSESEIVTDGEGRPGPGGTLLFRIEEVNGTPSSVLILDSNLKDVARIDRFLEQTTLVDQALIFQEGFTLGESRTYDVLAGAPPREVAKRQVDWQTGTMDRKFGEQGYAFMLCSQELRPGEFTSTTVVHTGAKFRCALNVVQEGAGIWTSTLADGETAALVGILENGKVVGQVHTGGSEGGRLVEWSRDGHSEILPWLPFRFQGEVDSASKDFSRYASFASDDARPCSVVGRLLGRPCKEADLGRWFVFDRKSNFPIVDRAFPRNGRAALSPDGLHYASLEANELRVYSLSTVN